jgi:hypothetical protein
MAPMAREKLAVTNDGRLLGWGASRSLGFASPDDSGGPAVHTASGIVGAALSQRDACVLLQGGAVRCNGASYDGAIAARDPVAIYGGDDVFCTLARDRSLSCWGSPGAIGNGSTFADSGVVTTPVRILDGVANVAVGVEDTCAVLTDGSARCWGRSQIGAVGDGTVEARFTPVAVCGLGDARAVAVGHLSCAIAGDGDVRCWGYVERARY